MDSPRPASIPEDSILHNPFESLSLDSPPHHPQDQASSTSPTIDGDYAKQLDSVLADNSRGNGMEEEEDEDEFGAFVYSGKDAEPPTIATEGGSRDYQERMDEVMGDTGIEKDVENEGINVGGEELELDTKLGRRVRNGGTAKVNEELRLSIATAEN